MFAGGSAGSRGAMIHMDYVPQMLAEAGANPDGIAVVGFMDSPLWIDIPPFQGSSFPGFRAVT